jgi:hypothetical protein
MKIIKYLKAVSWWLYAILFFCFAGIFRNVYHMNLFGYNYGNAATKVFVAMIVIYIAQAILILARERKAWIISAVQAFFCFYVYEDFTFLPFANMVRSIVLHFVPDIDYGWMHFLTVTMMSALFSLELLKTYLIYTLTEELPRKKPAKLRAPHKEEDAAEQPAV